MDKKVENQIAEIIDQIEKIAKDYQLAIRKGRFEIACPYPKLIKIYEDVSQLPFEQGWNEQAVIFNRQIKFYNKKLESDKNLRKIEEKR